MRETVEAHITPVAKDSCPRCFRGFVTVTFEEADEEIYVAIPCKSCQPTLVTYPHTGNGGTYS